MYLILKYYLPKIQIHFLCILIDLAENTTIKNTKKAVQCVENILETIPQIQNLQTYYGMGAPVDFIGLIKGSALRSGEYSAQIVANLSKAKNRDVTSFNIVQNTRDMVGQKCSQYKNIVIVEEAAGPAVYGAIVAEIYGKDVNKRDEIAYQIESIFKEMDTLTDVEIKNGKPFKKFTVHIDKVKAVKYGLSVEQINKILYIALEGVSIAVKNEDRLNEQIPIYLALNNLTKKIKNANKEDIVNKLSSLNLMNLQGQMISLSEVVSVEKSLTQPIMYSKNLQDYTFVSCETKLASPIYPWGKALDIVKEKMSKQYEVSNGSIFEFKKGKYFDLYLKDKKTGETYQIVWDGEIQITLDILKDRSLFLKISICLVLVLIFGATTLANILQGFTILL